MRKKVIIYDDDSDLLEVCSLILQSRNFEVITKDKCTTILTDLEKYEPDVVIMDNWIPDIGGIKATRLMKESSRFQHIPVIFFSANNDVNEMAADAGAEFSLQKPFDISDLENIVVKAATSVHSS